MTEKAMNDETVRRLLDRAEADFRAQSAEIESMARPSRSLQDDVGEMNSSGQHPVDLAADIVEREIAVGLLADADAVLVEIDAARHRLSAGVFGRCEACGRDIDPERLAAVPWARRCTADESHVESTWHEAGIDESLMWPSDSTVLELAGDDSAWDPEDDHPALSTEELALHELNPRRNS